MINAIGFYGLLVGRTALDAMNGYGIVCHSNTRDCSIAKLCENLVQRQSAYFGNFDAISFCINNFRKGIKLKYKRGGNNTYDLLSMHMMAHAVREFYNTAWDGLHVKLEYAPNQKYPSPAYMPDYPEYDKQPSTEFYLEH